MPPCGLHAGALQQVVANDPFAQRLVSALSPTLTPILEYASRTPFFSSILTNIGASDNPVVSLPMHAHVILMGFNNNCPWLPARLGAKAVQHA